MLYIYIDGKIKNRGHGFVSLEEALEFLRGYFVEEDAFTVLDQQGLEVGKVYTFESSLIWSGDRRVMIEIRL